MPYSRDYFIKIMPLTIGLILTLTSLSFLINSRLYYFDDMSDERFLLFVFFAIIGFPLMLYGIDKANDTD